MVLITTYTFICLVTTETGHGHITTYTVHTIVTVHGFFNYMYIYCSWILYLHIVFMGIATA